MVKDFGGWGLAGVLGDAGIECFPDVTQLSLRALVKIPQELRMILGRPLH